MKREITIDKALKRYHQIIYTVVITALIAFFVTAFHTSNHFSYGIAIIISFTVFIFGLLLLFPALNIWKFWAFSRVRNVHELKNRLISLNYISEQSKFFKRIENSTENDGKYWKLYLKFTQDDIFVDDETIPDETVIYYSKTLSILLIVGSIFTFAFGFFMLKISDEGKSPTITLFGVFFSIVAVVIFCKECMKLKKRKPQLILNNKGIEIAKTGFHKWEEIEKYKIVSYNKSIFLNYQHSRGEESIEISKLDINSVLKFSKLLMVYHERNKSQNK